MLTIVKGLLALQIAVLIICAIYLTGTLLMSVLAFLGAALCIVVPFVLKLVCVVFVVVVTLWGLGTVVNEIQKSMGS